jgi:hypothetical protein
MPILQDGEWKSKKKKIGVIHIIMQPAGGQDPVVLQFKYFLCLMGCEQ